MCLNDKCKYRTLKSSVLNSVIKGKNKLLNNYGLNLRLTGSKRLLNEFFIPLFKQELLYF